MILFLYSFAFCFVGSELLPVLQETDVESSNHQINSHAAVDALSGGILNGK
jgi:hypothetical protein